MNTGAQKIVLVADGHEDSRMIYSAVLEFGGFRVLEAGSGAEALALMPAQMPHVIVTELRLPDFDFSEMLRRVKLDPSTAHIPVLVVTSDIRPGTREQAERDGCDAFRTKPCPPYDVLQLVRQLT
jgi:CheY-like chemotaxis protein